MMNLGHSTNTLFSYSEAEIKYAFFQRVPCLQAGFKVISTRSAIQYGDLVTPKILSWIEFSTSLGREEHLSRTNVAMLHWSSSIDELLENLQIRNHYETSVSHASLLPLVKQARPTTVNYEACLCTNTLFCCSEVEDK